LAGGIAGGFLGSLLFSSLAGAGTGLGGFGGSGFGFLEILLLAGGAYLLYTFVRRGRPGPALAGAHGAHGGFGGGGCGGGAVAETEPASAPHAGHEPSPVQVGSEDELRGVASDIFFQVQAAWASGDLARAKEVMAPDVYEAMAADLEALRREGRTNRLENIALRRVEIGEAWQEDGREFFQTRLTATLLDYTVNVATGELVSGSRTEPARFTEDWTFVRDRAGLWRLAAIRQV
jgi:predicted lipid-binding transport protein (Tim44 family)